MSAYPKLLRAVELLQLKLKDRIKELSIDEDLVRAKFILKSNVRIYVNFNNYEQYSYVIFYSPDPMDRIIIDNYDEEWDVSSKPNHIHHRHEKEGIKTVFTGDPETDIYRLIELI